AHRPPRRRNRAAHRPGRQAAQPDHAPACGAATRRGSGPPDHLRRPGRQRIRPGHLAARVDRQAVDWRTDMTTTPAGPTLPEITHHRAEVNGTSLHYAAAGTSGSPILLVHGFPETWWAFHKLIPLLAANHHVFAVDLRGFGDSGNGPGEYDSA